MRIAIVGTGISAMTAAYLLHRDHELTVFDKADYIGGHTNTLDITLDGVQYPVDTGFIVFNDWTYPNFIRLLDRLGVESRESTMSFAVSCWQTDFEYYGGSITGLFGQKRNLFSPKFYGMLLDILRFNKLAKRFAENGDDQTTMRQFAQQHGLGDMFYYKYLVPITASIWSATPGIADSMPMRFMAEFFRNHGMLNIWDRPQWRTVVGGSRAYMNKLTEPFVDRIRLRDAVTAVRRYEDHIELDSEQQQGQRFDHVVFGCHSDQALAILGDGATEDEQRALSSIPYQNNLAILHTDLKMLPVDVAPAAWNYIIPEEDGKPVILTYNMNILQGHEAPQQICVTLNAQEHIHPGTVIAKIPYEHPVFTPDRKDAHELFEKINHRHRTSFCGAYWRYGFHEDGVVSALNAVEPFGVSL